MTQPGVKPPSRFSSLNVLKRKPGSDLPPLPPPKDSPLTPPSAFYNTSLFSRSATSLPPSLSPDTNSGPSSPYPSMPSAVLEFGKRSRNILNGRAAAGSPSPSASGGSLKSSSPSGRDGDGSTDSSSSCPNANANLDVYLLNGANSSSYTVGQATMSSVKRKKSVFKLASLAKRNKSKKDLSDTASASESVSRSVSVGEHEGGLEKIEGDEGITLPWNFQHHIHVDEGYIGLPPSWSAALTQVGFSEEEITLIHARRRAAITGFASNTDLAKPHATHSYSTERPASPRLTVTPPDTATATSSSITLLEPVPRSTSLGKGLSAFTTQSPSSYSVATGTSPAPSPRAMSFSMKSFVSGIKNSLTSDAASSKEDGRGEGAAGNESEQYVMVDGSGPDEGADQDETLIEPYPFDTSSVSSHHTHTSRTRQMSQDQQTPRTPSFPQIQTYRAQSEAGRATFPSPTLHAPSPLSHSASLPLPTPPRGYTHTNLSISPSPVSRSAPLSAPPRTPPKRIYHVVNASSDSNEGENYAEPPPAYASLKKEEWIPRKEKEAIALGEAPPPNRPIPPIPVEQTPSEHSGVSRHDNVEMDQEVSVAENSDHTMRSSVNDIPGTADRILDISSHYSDNSVHGGDAEMDPAEPARVLSPALPLVIDKRISKLAILPPRISFHQESSLEDWSQSLFSVIGGKGKRSSILMGGDAASGNAGIRPIPLSTTTRGASVITPNSLSREAVVPSLPDISLGVNLALGPHTRPTVGGVKEEEHAKDSEEGPRDAPQRDAGGEIVGINATTKEAEGMNGFSDLPSTPPLPDPSVSPLGKDPEPPAAISPSPASPHRPSIDNPPPSPPPKPKPKPAPLVPPAIITPTLPKTNVITGISGKSPVNSLFGVKPHPLPIPIPLSQIRAQLRPAPPKSAHSSPTLPLTPLKRIPSQPNFQPPLLPSLLTPLPSPRRAFQSDSTASPASPSNSRPNSSQTLQPAHTVPGDRDSGMSTITVTPATITTAKTELVRTAIASVIDPDVVSLASRRESVVSTADTEPEAVTCNEPEIGGESPSSQEHGEAPDDSLVSKTSSASLLRDDPQSKWPAPPPPPVERTDSTPRRISRFRTTSLGRVSQLHAAGGSMVSPVDSHSPHWSPVTTASSSSESMPLPALNGVNGASPSGASKARVSLAAEAKLLTSRMSTFGGVDESDNEDTEASLHSPEGSPPAHPLLAQLQPYVAPRNPTTCFADLVEIAEGESGSVFAARVLPSFEESRPEGQQATMERPIPPGTSHVAIKRIALPPPSLAPSLSDDSPVSNKLVSVLHELCLLKNLDHEHLLLLDAVYVGPTSSEPEESEFAAVLDTSLWIRMELMERSLADVIGLVAEGLALQERLIGRFASDVLHGLDYLQRQHIAHRDVRSDNLLVNAAGVLKLADFSNAIRVDRNSPTVSGAVGVVYWQAPEMRAGPYNALKVDTWSLGATVWELAETVPPFSMPASPSNQVSFAIQTAQHLGSQWPPLTHPEHYSRAFHEFLRLCGRESATRPSPGELLNVQFIRNACGRPVILQLLSQCRSIEETMAAKEASTGQS